MSLGGAGTLKLHGSPAWRIHLVGMLTWLVINAGLWFCFVWFLVGRTRVVWYVGAASYAGVVLFHGILSSRRGCGGPLLPDPRPLLPDPRLLLSDPPPAAVRPPAAAVRPPAPSSPRSPRPSTTRVHGIEVGTSVRRGHNRPV